MSVDSPFASSQAHASGHRRAAGDDEELIIISGLGAPSHSARSSSPFIFRCGRPEGAALQHALQRFHLGGFEQTAMPTPARKTDVGVGATITQYGVGLAIRTTAPLTGSPERRVEMVLAAFPQIEQELIAGAR